MRSQTMASRASTNTIYRAVTRGSFPNTGPGESSGARTAWRGGGFALSTIQGYRTAGVDPGAARDRGAVLAVLPPRPFRVPGLLSGRTRRVQAAPPGALSCPRLRPRRLPGLRFDRARWTRPRLRPHWPGAAIRSVLHRAFAAARRRRPSGRRGDRGPLPGTLGGRLQNKNPSAAKFWRRLAAETGTNVQERLQPVPNKPHIPDDVILSFDVE